MRPSQLGKKREGAADRLPLFLMGSQFSGCNVPAMSAAPARASALPVIGSLGAPTAFVHARAAGGSPPSLFRAISYFPSLSSIFPSRLRVSSVPPESGRGSLTTLPRHRCAAHDPGRFARPLCFEQPIRVWFVIAALCGSPKVFNMPERRHGGSGAENLQGSSEDGEPPLGKT